MLNHLNYYSQICFSYAAFPRLQPCLGVAYLLLQYIIIKSVNRFRHLKSEKKRGHSLHIQDFHSKTNPEIHRITHYNLKFDLFHRKAYKHGINSLNILSVVLVEMTIESMVWKLWNSLHFTCFFNSTSVITVSWKWPLFYFNLKLIF